jgi:hypothetical protein
MPTQSDIANMPVEGMCVAAVDFRARILAKIFKSVLVVHLQSEEASQAARQASTSEPGLIGPAQSVVK